MSKLPPRAQEILVLEVLERREEIVVDLCEAEIEEREDAEELQMIDIIFRVCL